MRIACPCDEGPRDALCLACGHERHDDAGRCLESVDEPVCTCGPARVFGGHQVAKAMFAGCPVHAEQLGLIA